MALPSVRLDEDVPRLTDLERLPVLAVDLPETEPWLLRSVTRVVRLTEVGLALTDLSIRTV